MLKQLPRLALVALVCTGIFGLALIFQRHAQQAGSYPTFSSYRTLPEGSSILYEALSRTAGMTAERNVRALGTVHYSGAAILILGVSLNGLGSNAQWFTEMEDLAATGNRVIIAFVPHRNRFLDNDPKNLEASLKRWSVKPKYVTQLDPREDESGELVAGWPMYFATAAGWNTLRNDKGRAVVIERPQGKGRLVLLANPFLLTNAAMVDDRQTDFLASVLGPAHVAVFDETHFGIEQTGSIAGLARRYRLQGFFLGLVLTAALFIWKSAAGFPPAAAPPARGAVRGEDAGAAFLNLLRRNIKPEDILSTCVQTWTKLNRKSTQYQAAAIDLAEAGRKTPAAAYARIQQLLSPGAKHTDS